MASQVAEAPPIAGLHHIKLVVSNLDHSLDWYSNVLGSQHVSQYDHFDEDGKRYAVLLSLKALGNTLIELRQNAELARLHRKFDPVTFAVQGQADLRRWAEWLDQKGVKHSPVLYGVAGWLLVFEVGPSMESGLC